MLLATHILSRSQHITLLMPRDSGIQEHEMTNNKLKTTKKTDLQEKRNEKDTSINTGDVSDAIRKPLPSVVILVTPGST